MRVTFELGGFGRESLQALLDALVRIDVAYLKRHRRTPGLYQSGVRYQAESIGVEDFRDIPTILQYGRADCEGLAAWRVAQLRVQGDEHGRRDRRAKTRIRMRRMPNGTPLYHIQVRRGNGRTEDPSARLGMIPW